MGDYKYNPPVQVRAEDDTALLIDSAGNLQVKITDGTYDAEIDSHGYLVAIDQEHHKIHEGQMFTIAGRTTDLGSGDSVDLLLVTPDSATQIHAVMSMSCSGAGYGELWEDATALLAGTTLTAYNNDRNSGTTTTLIIYAEPTSLTLATAIRLDVRQIGGGNAGKFGSEVRQDTEWVLKQDKAYIVRYISGASSNDISFEIQYYEV